MNDSLISIQKTITLIRYYNFDLGNYPLREIIIKWSKIYNHEWLSLAVMEAIYQGKLKLVSVGQILNLWNKKRQVCIHFNTEFERLISFNLDFYPLREKEFRRMFFLENNTNLGKFINPTKTSNNCINSQEDKQSKINKNMTTIEGDFITNFQPLEDYSSCFHKLKSLVEQANLSKKLSFDDKS